MGGSRPRDEARTCHSFLAELAATLLLTMIVRSLVTRVTLLFPVRKVQRVWPHFNQNLRDEIIAASLFSPSRVWLSTSANEEKEVVSHTESNTNFSDVKMQATRSMFLGNILTLLGDTTTVVITGIALALGLLYVKQDSLLYIPEMDGLPRQNELNPPGYKSPAEYNIPFETHMIPTDEGKHAMHSWLLLHPRSKQDNLPTIMFLHGNAG